MFVEARKMLIKGSGLKEFKKIIEHHDTKASLKTGFSLSKF